MIDDDREWFESGKGATPTHRPEILTSWRRSRLNGVDPEHFDVGHAVASLDSQVARAGIPVLQATAEVMVGAGTSLFLTDPDGTVLWRWSESGRLSAILDRSSVVVGARMSEDVAGTNGIGTSLETARPILVSGTEHFNEALHPFTCAGAPVLHPVTHRVTGTLSVTTMAEEASPLMMTVLLKLVQEIEGELLDDSSARERELLQQFRERRRLGRSPVIAFNEDIMITDRTAAAVGVNPARLWGRPESEIAPPEVLRVYPADVCGTLTRSEISYRGSIIGVIVVGESANTPSAPDRPTSSSSHTGQALDLCWADLVGRMRDSVNEWDRILITGESGVGKRTIAHRVLDEPERPLREVDCAAVAETGAQHWLALARTILTDTFATSGTHVIISHLELLDNAQARALGRILDEVPRGADCPKIVGTYTPNGQDPPPSMRALLDRFQTEPFDLPPLRRRPADIIELLGGRGAPAPVVTAEAIEQICRHPWPGNNRQFNEFLRWLDRQQRPVIGLTDLPPRWSRGATRARLTAIQAAEADALEMALQTAQGNKSAAATALGLSRSSLYRKMREYRLN